MPKNIVIACDGTANQFGKENTNVVKLISMLEKNTEDQLVFYDTGVGTLAMPDMAPGWGTKATNFFSWLFGSGIKKNVQEAYTFLMNTYEAGDQVFLFGFSRGAYTVRMLAGMVNFCGLLPKGNEGQFSYVWNFYRIRKKKDPKEAFKMGFKFKKSMARNIKIKFVGTFDTVSTIGFGPWSKTFPYTLKNSSVDIARHAIAIDERRSHYRPKLWLENKEGEEDSIKTNIQQVWFPGAHCDVGGSYKEAESGLSKNALVWMACEAGKAGLLINAERFRRVALGEPGKSQDNYCKPDIAAPIHSEMRHFYFKLIELCQGNIRWKNFTFGQSRQIPEGAWLHHSVIARKQRTDLKYEPENLPAAYNVMMDDEEFIKVLAGGKQDV